ncbi:HIT-type domain-containing protein [Pseudozyma hubeiensis]|nr:HIT-type domain-containing protein [Pseudozyma hubeiensis]
MPAASTSVCEQCSLQPSKYTCPTCKFRTCSLACTRSHKASHSTIGLTTTAPSAASTSASPSAPKTDTTSFVPMTAYTEETMMSDYLFLSSISRKTSETGRNILSMNLLPPPTSTSAAETHHKPSSSSGGGMRMTNQQRQRDQLVKQLHYRRFKVMILPDGMARRKTNASGFVAKEKKFVLSVELTFPQTAAKVVHKQDSASTVDTVILSELQNRSFANKKDLSKIKASLTSTAVRKPTWIVSTRVLSESNLVLPKNAKSVEGEERGAGESLVELQSWPEEWAVLVPAYSARLTNESTTRYLEWWSRKRKWEEANPGLAEEQRLQAMAQGSMVGSRDGRDLHKGRAWEGKGRGDGEWGRKRDRGEESEDASGKRRWGRAEEQQEATVEPSAAEMQQTPEASTAPTTQSLISNTLLSMLSQRLGRSQPSPSLEPPSTPAFSQPDPPPESSSPPSAAQPESARSILTHITAPHRTTLGWLLQTLPDGYSVVEFPELRIIPCDDVEKMRGEHGLAVVELVGEGEEQVEEEDKEEAVSTVTQVAGASLGSLGLLAGYGSESEDELEEQAVAVDQSKAELKVGDGEEASGDQMNEADTSTLAQLARQHGLLSAPNTTA